MSINTSTSSRQTRTATNSLTPKLDLDFVTGGKKRGSSFVAKSTSSKVAKTTEAILNIGVNDSKKQVRSFFERGVKCLLEVEAHSTSNLGQKLWVEDVKLETKKELKELVKSHFTALIQATNDLAARNKSNEKDRSASIQEWEKAMENGDSSTRAQQIKSEIFNGYCNQLDKSIFNMRTSKDEEDIQRIAARVNESKKNLYLGMLSVTDKMIWVAESVQKQEEIRISPTGISYSQSSNYLSLSDSLLRAPTTPNRSSNSSLVEPNSAQKWKELDGNSPVMDGNQFKDVFSEW